MTVSSGGATQVSQRVPDVKIGNYFSDAPYGIAFIVDDKTGFLIDPVWDEKGAPTKYFAADPALHPAGDDLA